MAQSMAHDDEQNIYLLQDGINMHLPPIKSLSIGPFSDMSLKRGFHRQTNPADFMDKTTNLYKK